jgi:hypothetical protein
MIGDILVCTTRPPEIDYLILKDWNSLDAKFWKNIFATMARKAKSLEIFERVIFSVSVFVIYGYWSAPFLPVFGVGHTTLDTLESITLQNLLA